MLPSAFSTRSTSRGVTSRPPSAGAAVILAVSSGVATTPSVPVRAGCAAVSGCVGYVLSVARRETVSSSL
ncbi:hypothetical protein QR97_09550 [Streptomyces sp. PBH53]|nr:hypothetical protein QR97_09550 [Streptomyces sp. PBH53]